MCPPLFGGAFVPRLLSGAQADGADSLWTTDSHDVQREKSCGNHVLAPNASAGDDAHPFYCILLASASHSPLLDSAGRLGEAVKGEKWNI